MRRYWRSEGVVDKNKITGLLFPGMIWWCMRAPRPGAIDERYIQIKLGAGGD